MLELPAASQLSPLDAARHVADAARLRGEALDRDGAFPDQEIPLLQAFGLLAAPLPPELGGQGLTRGPALAGVLGALGAGSLPLGRLYEGHVNALLLVMRHGTPPQQQEAARDAREGRLFGVWNTDDSAAPLERDGPLLRGRKILASGAGWVERPLVTARSPDGPVMLLPRLAPGIRADLSGWTAQGMRASATGAVDFTGLPAGEPIGAPGDYLAEPDFSGGAWRCLAVQAGGMAELFGLLVAHLKRLGRDGDPHQRARIGEAAVALETARLWVDQAARVTGGCAEAPGGPADIAAYVNLARRAVEGAALRLLELAERSVGLQGFMRPHPIERVARDLATYLRQPAPDLALDRAAAHILA